MGQTVAVSGSCSGHFWALAGGKLLVYLDFPWDPLRLDSRLLSSILDPFFEVRWSSDLPVYLAFRVFMSSPGPVFGRFWAVF
jgi:hypothetical protein